MSEGGNPPRSWPLPWISHSVSRVACVHADMVLNTHISNSLSTVGRDAIQMYEKSCGGRTRSFFSESDPSPKRHRWARYPLLLLPVAQGMTLQRSRKKVVPFDPYERIMPGGQT